MDVALADAVGWARHAAEQEKKELQKMNKMMHSAAIAKGPRARINKESSPPQRK